MARDAPVLFAAAVCLWALSRRGPWLRRPDALVALGLACVSGRLVFESVVLPYYLLAPSVLFFLLDLVARRSPYRSLAWCAGAAFFVAVRPGNHAVDAFGTLRRSRCSPSAPAWRTSTASPRRRRSPTRAVRRDARRGLSGPGS